MTVHLCTYRLEGLQVPSDSEKILEEISPFLLIAIPEHRTNSVASLPVRAILRNMSGFATPKTIAFGLCFIAVNLHRLSSLGFRTGTVIPAVFPKRVTRVRVRYRILAHHAHHVPVPWYCKYFAGKFQWGDLHYLLFLLSFSTFFFNHFFRCVCHMTQPITFRSLILFPCICELTISLSLGVANTQCKSTDK